MGKILDTELSDIREDKRTEELLRENTNMTT